MVNTHNRISQVLTNMDNLQTALIDMPAEQETMADEMALASSGNFPVSIYRTARMRRDSSIMTPR